ncbi:DsbE family thiol:disulfide interchange protein [Litorivivens sp.]|uniref:DsbE family thiol:disulfide interchange protein n=1 Tax=Litorivivens sp. TaxID=2020868 RepID=UPI00356715FA
MGRLKLFIPLILFLVLAALFYAVETRVSDGEYDPKALPSALIGQPFPAFELPALLSGEPVDESLLKGQISIVNVWATWCPTCLYEHPYLVELAERGEVAVFAINYKDDPEKARRWLADKGNPFRVNIVDQTGQLGLDLGVTGAPETFVVDRAGVVHMRYQGGLDQAVWDRHFAPLIAKLKAAEGMTN